MRKAIATFSLASVLVFGAFIAAMGQTVPKTQPVYTNSSGTPQPVDANGHGLPVQCQAACAIPSAANGGANVNVVNGDEGRTLVLAPATSPPMNAASTIYQVVAGSTLHNEYVWGAFVTGNAVAAVTATIKTGEQSVTACDTNCIPWGPATAVAATATNNTCLWGVPVPPGAWGNCNSAIGIPLPMTNPATNLYVVTGSTVPTAGTTTWAYWTPQF